MSHIIIILGETKDCALEQASNADKTELVALINSIWEAGSDLQRKPHPPFGGDEEVHEALTAAQNFLQSVCNGNVENRESEAQTILDAIEALL